MTVTTEEFLAHFGIRGMKWGVRHQIGSNGRVTGRPDGGLTRKQKIGIGVAATAAVGLSAAAIVLKVNGKRPLSEIAKLLSQGKVAAKKILKNDDRMSPLEWAAIPFALVDAVLTAN